MTRRELRERERSAILRSEAPSAALIADAPVAVPERFNTEFVAPRIIESEHSEPAVVDATTVSSVSAPMILPHQSSATDHGAAHEEDSERKSQSAKASHRSSPRRTARQRSTGHIYGFTLMQAMLARSLAWAKTARASPEKPFKRRMVAKFLSAGAITGAGLMIVSTSVPANAFFSGEASTPLVKSAPVAERVQAVEPVPLAAALPAVSRDGYTATSLREQILLRYGNRRYLYSPNPNGTIRWPFPFAVPISDDFGYRVPPCSGCSSNHKGLDMVAGDGAPISAIADGVVVGVNNNDWSFGQHVIVEHVINGQRIESWYAHMQEGSIRVQLGDQLKVGDQIGLVGSTGASTGSHLHLEIHVNGVPVDPFAWLQENAD